MEPREPARDPPAPAHTYGREIQSAIGLWSNDGCRRNGALLRRREVNDMQRYRLGSALCVAALLLVFCRAPAQADADYPWLPGRPESTLADRFAPPPGFTRVPANPNSYGEWLRRLPLKPEASSVVLHDGRPVIDHGTVAAVIDIDIGRSDLQQCADAVMRLRAEYLFSRRLTDLIGFALLNGERYRFASYVEGTTPAPVGDGISWQRGRPRGNDHADLRRWLDIVFGFASTRSLARELRAVDMADAAIGDVFIRPGNPGHALVIVDMAVDPDNGRKLALLAQSSTPARDIHLLRNALDPRLGSWFPLVAGRPLITPGRVFAPNELKRF